MGVHSGYGRGVFKEEVFHKNKLFYMELFVYAEQYDVNILTENFIPESVTFGVVANG